MPKASRTTHDQHPVRSAQDVVRTVDCIKHDITPKTAAATVARAPHLVGHAEDVVDVSHELQGAHDLLLDLVLAAEDVRVVLTETPYAGETRQGSAQLKEKKRRRQNTI